MAEKTPPAPGSLDALAIEADNLTDTSAPGADQTGQDTSGQEQPQQMTNAQIIAGAIAAGRTVFCAVTKLESPAIHLSDEKAQQLGAVWGPVCDKYGWSLNDAIGGYAVEFAALIVTAQIGFELRAAVREEIAARAAKPVQPEPVEVGAASE